MAIEKQIFNEIMEISSTDFWEDNMIYEYEELIIKNNQFKNIIFQYLYNNFNVIKSVKNQLFIIDILTLPIYDCSANFDLLIRKFQFSSNDFFLERLIDNLRAWDLDSKRKIELFDLSKKIKNKNSLIYKIIGSDNIN